MRIDLAKVNFSDFIIGFAYYECRECYKNTNFPNSFFPTRVVIVSLYLDVTNYITMGMFVQKNNYGGCG
jgi:hypothetical protein